MGKKTFTILIFIIFSSSVACADLIRKQSINDKFLGVFQIKNQNQIIPETYVYINNTSQLFIFQKSQIIAFSPQLIGYSEIRDYVWNLNNVAWDYATGMLVFFTENTKYKIVIELNTRKVGDSSYILDQYFSSYDNFLMFSIPIHQDITFLHPYQRDSFKFKEGYFILNKLNGQNEEILKIFFDAIIYNTLKNNLIKNTFTITIKDSENKSPIEYANLLINNASYQANNKGTCTINNLIIDNTDILIYADKYDTKTIENFSIDPNDNVEKTIFLNPKTTGDIEGVIRILGDNLEKVVEIYLINQTTFVEYTINLTDNNFNLKDILPGMYSIKINNQKYFHPKEVQINKAEKTFQEIYVFEENTISNMFSQEQLNQAVADAVGQFDVNNDGMIGLQEAIHALQITAGAN